MSDNVVTYTRLMTKTIYEEIVTKTKYTYHGDKIVDGIKLNRTTSVRYTIVGSTHGG